LREVNRSRFTESDLHKVVQGGVLRINPFRQLAAGEIRRLCIEPHHEIEALGAAGGVHARVSIRAARRERGSRLGPL